VQPKATFPGSADGTIDPRRSEPYAFPVMASLTIPVTVAQLVELARQLSPEERRALLDTLLVDRFEATLSECDRRRRPLADLTDDEIQAEVDAVRQQRRLERHRAPGG